MYDNGKVDPIFKVVLVILVVGVVLLAIGVVLEPPVFFRALRR